jgi:hypothetical protein
MRFWGVEKRVIKEEWRECSMQIWGKEGEEMGGGYKDRYKQSPHPRQWAFSFKILMPWYTYTLVGY